MTIELAKSLYVARPSLVGSVAGYFRTMSWDTTPGRGIAGQRENRFFSKVLAVQRCQEMRRSPAAGNSFSKPQELATRCSTTAARVTSILRGVHRSARTLFMATIVYTHLACLARRCLALVPQDFASSPFVRAMMYRTAYRNSKGEAVLSPKPELSERYTDMVMKPLQHAQARERLFFFLFLFFRFFCLVGASYSAPCLSPSSTFANVVQHVLKRFVRSDQ